MKELHNLRTNYSIDMKLFKPLSKLDERDTTLTLRKFGDELFFINFRKILSNL